MNITDYTDDIKSVDNPEGLPFITLCWINDHEILAAGFSNHPVLYSEGSRGWEVSKILDRPVKSAGKLVASTGDDEEEGAFGMSALRKFKELDLKGKVSQQEEKSTHVNSITELAPYKESNNNVTQVSSVGLDGKLVIYKL